MDILRRRFLNGLVLSIACLASGTASVAASALDSTGAIESTSEIQGFVEGNGILNVSGVRVRNRGLLNSVYKARNFAPLWTRDDFPTHTSIVVARRLANASEFGLEPSKYYGRLLSRLATESYQSPLIEFEILMTDAVISYFDDIAHGSTEPPSAKDGWHHQRARLNVPQAANEFFNGEKSFSESVDTLHPHNDRFNRLLNSLREHRAIAETGGWGHVPRGAALAYGDTSSRIVDLRRRLSVSGDLPHSASHDPEYFDNHLVQALIRFQSRHGLEADGVLGPNTLKTLNVPVEERIAQINLNLDRWRWLSREPGHSNITVNTAGFDMDVTLNGSVAMNMNVIVGKPDNATPLFSDTMEHMVYNPSWFVPRSISRKLLRQEQRMPGYLAGKNFEVRLKATNTVIPFNELSSYDLDPNYFSSKYWLRQLPGEDNALGQLKFMFPNKYSIYLHDTNSPQLFAEAERAFSHGCIRLEQPRELAELLLTADGKSSYEIEEYELINWSKTVNLNTPLPVHLTYQTAWVDDTGELNFREDIYKHDRHALTQLESNHNLYAQAEINALALSGITLVSNLQ